MKIIRDFRCGSCALVFEEMVENTATSSIPCEECGRPAHHIISAIAFHLDNSFPGYHDKWAKDHEKGAKNPDKAHKHW